MRKNTITNLYNDTGIDVTEWVKYGRTFLFNCMFEARKKALEIHSYVYEVHDNTGNRLGWAVPK